MKELRLIHELLRVAIGTLNWTALGSPLHCPAEARCGMPVSEDHLDMQCVLERHIKHFVQAPTFEASSLGRSEARFAHLLSVAQPDRSFACNFTRAKFLHAKRGIIFLYYKNACKKLHFCV